MYTTPCADTAYEGGPVPQSAADTQPFRSFSWCQTSGAGAGEAFVVVVAVALNPDATVVVDAPAGFVEPRVAA
jgi:hypothetical protein